MCLGVPGRVVRWIDRAEPFARAELEFGGIRREVAMDCALEAAEGDYVMVHAGVAISVLSAEDARETLADLSRLGPLAAAVDEAAGEPRSP